jgi:hypothetical protein
VSRSRDSVVAVRSEDVLTFLNHCLQKNGLPVEYSDKSGERMREKEIGWYYLTPVYSSILEGQTRIKGRSR